MAKVTTDENGVNELTSLANALKDCCENVNNALLTLQTSIQEKENLLGPHIDEIQEILETINDAQNTGLTDVDQIYEMIMELAKNISEFISGSVLNDEKGCHSSSNESTAGSNRVMGNSKGMDDTSKEFSIQSFRTDLYALRSTMDLGPGDENVQQLAGRHKDVQKKEADGFESHHIPSAAVLREFGIDTDEWPTIALEGPDHAATDSYRGKQKRKYKSIFPDVPPSMAYRDESIKMVDTSGGFIQLVRNEILNVKKCCGGKYDGAIAKYFHELERYIESHGVPQRKE